MLFILARRADFRLPHLLALASLALYLAWISTPPPDRPHLMTFTQEQPCLDDPTAVFTDPVTRPQLQQARTAAQLYAERGERVVCAAVRAPPR
ncbi:hypothetical protein [Stutzerimonas nitrititolerans]|uniref:hypothetical protein n=1 Tax=Stutzerimonas nitrititolerans TaxID=2482751 RepID=UPI00289B683B|nr:hypothetical protein [Stutzerimonas nitrititolerans]